MEKIKFHLPGLTAEFVMVNMIFVDLLREHPEYFHDNIKIESFYGAFPNMLWNGGRICTSQYAQHINSAKEAIRLINEAGISIRFTFTNLALEEKDLDDWFCNECLKAAHNEMNAVIVATPLLENYIRKNYPKYKIVSSITKGINSIEEQREELHKDYNLVVLNHNFNDADEIFNFTKEEKDKCEILVNQGCIRNCPYTDEHYMIISKNHKALVEEFQSGKKTEQIPFTCKFSDHPEYTSPTYISPENLYGKYALEGFNNFKIRGRGRGRIYLEETYCLYLVKKEYKDEICKIVESYINDVIIEYPKELQTK